MALTHTILQVTDLHYLPVSGEKMYEIDTEYYFCWVLQQAIKSRSDIDLILVTGDLTQTPSPSSYQRIYKELKKTGIPVNCLPGNHDNWSQMQNQLNYEKIRCEKHKWLGNWLILCLNSQKPNHSGGMLSEQEFIFLKKKLEQYPKNPTLIAIHHNVLPMGSNWLDTMTLENYHQLFDILKKQPQVKTLVHGHTHQEKTLKIDNLEILSTPSTCFQFKPESQNFTLDPANPGYRIIDLHPEGKITSEVIRVAIP